MSVRCLVSLSVYSLLFHGTIAIDPPRDPYQPTGGGEKLLSFKETVTTPKFESDYLEVSWLSSDEDGLSVYLSDAGSLILESYATGEKETFVPKGQIPSDYWEYWIRSDFKKVMFSTNYTQQYRHSYFANYEVLDVASGQSTPLVEDQAGDIQYAEFAPSGNLIAFVKGNELYIKDISSDQITRITNDGGPDMFHGVPDWVYEEEILGDRFALWFSPDAQFLSFMSFNETGVGTFTIPYYMNDSKIAPPYPRQLELRYPKVGTTNPTVMMTVLDLSSMDLSPVPIDAFPPHDLIVGEVAWATDGHASLIYRAFNRVQTLEKYVTVSVPSIQSKVHRERDGSDGWLDNLLSMNYVGSIGDGDQNYYLDISDASGWYHLYLVSVLMAAKFKS